MLAYIWTIIKMMCSGLSSALERNNHNDSIPSESERFINSLNNWYSRKAIFSNLFSARYHILKKKKKKMLFANVAVVLKITLLLLATSQVSLNCLVTFGITDQTLPNFQGSHNYIFKCCLQNHMTNGWELTSQLTSKLITYPIID